MEFTQEGKLQYMSFWSIIMVPFLGGKKTIHLLINHGTHAAEGVVPTRR
jgi:hypothetical protein